MKRVLHENQGYVCTQLKEFSAISVFVAIMNDQLRFQFPHDPFGSWEVHGIRRKHEHEVIRCFAQIVYEGFGQMLAGHDKIIYETNIFQQIFDNMILFPWTINIQQYHVNIFINVFKLFTTISK